MYGYSQPRSVCQSYRLLVDFSSVCCCCCFLVVDELSSASKASLSCSTLEKLRGFSCNAGGETRAACEGVKTGGSGTGLLESTMREVEMEEDAEEELVQNRQVWCQKHVRVVQMKSNCIRCNGVSFDTWKKIGKPSAF